MNVCRDMPSQKKKNKQKNPQMSKIDTYTNSIFHSIHNHLPYL